MKKTPQQPETRPALAAGRATQPTSPESEVLSGREKLEDTLGGALTRVLSRAGLAVRVVPSASPDAVTSATAADRKPAARPEAPAACQPTDSAPAPRSSGGLPARDELITLISLVLGGKVLDLLTERAATDHPASVRTPAASPAIPPRDPLHGTPWLAAPAPPVTGPPEPAPASALPPAAAANPGSGKASFGPTKGRGFTIRY
jgi:hypothetical protein